MVSNNARTISRVPSWILLAAFGPYLFGVARVDQIIIYPLAILAVMTLFLRSRTGILFQPTVSTIFLVFVSVTLYTLLITVGGERHYELLGKVVSGFENYAQPAAVILIMGVFVRPRSETEAVVLFRSICRLLVILLSLNSVLVILSVFLDLSPVTRYFTTGLLNQDNLSTSALAARYGRYSGIFNQPVESGLTYSLGLFCWAYLSHAKRRSLTRDYLLLWLMLLGGILSASKAFILMGVPLFIVYWLSARRLFDFQRLPELATGRFIFSALLGSCSTALVFGSWSGLGFVTRLFTFREDQNLLDLFTGHRFGTDTSQLKDILTRTWNDGFLFGLGFGAETIFDSAYAEFFVESGLVGLIGYVLVLGCIGWLALEKSGKGSEERRLLLALWVLSVGVGIGAPVLTLNRFGAIFWVVFMLLYEIIHSRRKRCRYRLKAEYEVTDPLLSVSAGGS